VRPVLQWVQDERALCETWAYPYQAAQDVCKLCDGSRSFSIANIYSGSNAEEVRNLIFQYGPTSIYFYVETQFHSYRSGTYECSAAYNTINHAVAAVGYGVGYLKLRNSWGPTWGADGYFWLQDGTCAMFLYSYGVNAVAITDASESNMVMV